MTTLSEFRVRSDDAKRMILDLLLELADVITQSIPPELLKQAKLSMDMDVVYHDFTLCRVYPELVRIEIDHPNGDAQGDKVCIMIANRIPDTKKNFLVIPELPFLDKPTVDMIRPYLGKYGE